MDTFFKLVQINSRLKNPIYLLRPAINAMLIRTNVVQPHFVLSTSGLRLKEDGFPILTFRTRMVLRPWKRRVRNDVAHDVGQFINLVRNFVDVDAVVVSQLLVVAVPAGVQQLTPFLILPRVQHVVALGTKLDSNKGRTLTARRTLDAHSWLCHDDFGLIAYFIP